MKIAVIALALVLMTIAVVVGCKKPIAGPVIADQPDRPRIVAFTADYCAACKRDKPALTKANEAGIWVTLIDAPSHPRISLRFEVTYLPTYFVYAGGNVVRTNDVNMAIRLASGGSR